jgi:hypothetical protein
MVSVPPETGARREFVRGIQETFVAYQITMKGRLGELAGTEDAP